MWKLELGYYEKPIVKCQGAKCGDLKVPKVITHLNEGEHVYDQPTAARALLGLMGYINDFTERPIETTHMQISPNLSLQMFFNCKKSSVEAVLAKPIKRDYTEISFSQNLLDNLGFPHEIQMTTD